ncbi:CCA tRNA nucleotidyltransferase [Adlercreutzia sp. ZJ141]|uniref:CCA tRNA nucleotidyltransferase n=1 Tax=Adlercreutzia sp. ZJ141 TaxID=2709406 RepID=UPI0013EDAE70|nr:HD domain-containing protein [Adlercreutzia sp. ZJ141]
MHSINLPNEALAALSILEDAGFEAWGVGGCVRDMLLGRACSDIDIATSATCSDVQATFERCGLRVHDTGSKHGTVTVIVGDAAFETTTYRTDGTYSDGRHPDQVRFVTSIQEDLARRDFTINAMAYHPERGLIDPYGGRCDLQRGVIRTVGDPVQRFSEDALRILRGCRFCAQFGFPIEQMTLQAMIRSKKLMAGVSRERVTAELTKLLTSPYAGSAIMNTVDALSAVLPELVAMKGFDQKTPYHIYDVLEHTAHVVDAVRPTPTLRWAALLHDVGKPAAFFTDDTGTGHFYGHANISRVVAEGVMNRMSFSAVFRQQVVTLVEHHDDVIDTTPKAVKRAVRRLGGNEQLFRMLCELKRGDSKGQAPQYHTRIAHATELERILDDIIREDEAFKIGDLAINGNDVIAAGVERGPLVGHVLNAALDAVIEGTVQNEPYALRAFVRDWAAKKH